MLKELHIENIAVIEKLDISFSGGLTVLTGETGAGKSIIIDSINMILGDRISKDIIRTGCDRGFVSALFENLSSETLDILRDLGYDSGESGLIISREISSDGKSSVRINGRHSNLSILKEVSPNLISILGQNDSTDLLDSRLHLSYLDSFSGTESELREYKDLYCQTRKIRNELDNLNMDEELKNRKIDLLKYQINEIKEAELTEGEDDTLTNRRNVLSNIEKIISSVNDAMSVLNSEDYSVRDMLSNAYDSISRIAKYDESIEGVADRFSNVISDFEDIFSEIEEYAENLDFDQEELDKIEDRLSLIKNLKRKYGSTVSEVQQFCDNAKKELDEIEFSDEKIEELKHQLSVTESKLSEAASVLTSKRKKSSNELEKRIVNELSYLDMPGASFSVDIRPSDYSSDGADSVEFLLSANKGETLKSLSKIASGGELSRIMLSIKSVLSKNSLSTLIFDEIDTGVSGSAASKIAVKLHSMALNNQVIVVTHLAQIAAYGDNHIFISKVVENGRTFTKLHLLDREGRISELSRIMGGSSETIRAAAAELLDSALKK